MHRTVDFCRLARAVIDIETQAITDLLPRINENFANACDIFLRCTGRIIVTGMGKSGHIASKIASTLASTGSPAFFVHPAEAHHGDLGMITANDVVLAISYSGETYEIINLVPLIKRLGIPLISMTGNPDSTLARRASINLDISVKREACPLDLAPTASTTASLVMGDAIAISLLEARGFTAEDFARSHPGGSLGRKLLLLVEDVMHRDHAIPRVLETATLSAALVEMTEKKLGITTVVDKNGVLKGVFTDGDLRRAFEKNIDVHKTLIANVMTHSSHTISPNLLAAEALRQMEQFKISAVVVVDEHNKPIGIVHFHDLLKAGVA